MGIFLYSVEGIYNALSVLIIMKAFSIFFDKRRTSILATTFMYLLGFALVTGLFILLRDLEGLIAVSIFQVRGVIAIFVASLCYKSSMLKRLAVISCISFLISMVSFLSLMFMELLRMSFLADLIGMHFYIIFQGTVVFLSTYLIFELLGRRFKDIRNSVVYVPTFWAMVLAITSAVNIAAILSEIGLYRIGSFLSTSTLLATGFMFFYLYDALSKSHNNKLKSALHAQEREYYLTQCQLMHESAERMKSFKHDIELHLTALKDYTAGNKVANDYLGRLLGDIEKSEVYSDTGNLPFDSIINYKLRNAEHDGIKLDIGLFIPPIINVEVADIVVILGNLLDNALEAVEKADKKIIMLNIKYDKGGLFIKTNNSFDGEVEYLDDDCVIATSKGEDGHGYGLKNVKKAVEKYGGHMHVDYDDGVFSVGVFLFCG